jgi:hypothetical protein
MRAVGLDPHILVVAWVNAFFKDSWDQWGSAGHVRSKRLKGDELHRAKSQPAEKKH